MGGVVTSLDPRSIWKGPSQGLGREKAARALWAGAGSLDWEVNKGMAIFDLAGRWISTNPGFHERGLAAGERIPMVQGVVFLDPGSPEKAKKQTGPSRTALP